MSLSKLQVGKPRLCYSVRLRLKCDGTHTETRFRLPAKRTSPFKSARSSSESTTGSRVVHISGSNTGYTMFRASVKGTGYPLHSSVSLSLPLPRATVCHHISIGFYKLSFYFYHNRKEDLPWKHRGGLVVYLYSFLNLGANGNGWLCQDPTALPPGMTRYPFYRGWMGFKACVDGCGKSAPPPHRH
jgi:hypothetical protein